MEGSDKMGQIRGNCGGSRKQVNPENNPIPLFFHQKKNQYFSKDY